MSKSLLTVLIVGLQSLYKEVANWRQIFWWLFNGYKSNGYAFPARVIFTSDGTLADPKQYL